MRTAPGQIADDEQLEIGGSYHALQGRPVDFTGRLPKRRHDNNAMPYVIVIVEFLFDMLLMLSDVILRR
jgi:hypothetical protein